MRTHASFVPTKGRERAPHLHPSAALGALETHRWPCLPPRQVGGQTFPLLEENQDWWSIKYTQKEEVVVAQASCRPLTSKILPADGYRPPLKTAVGVERHSCKNSQALSLPRLRAGHRGLQVGLPGPGLLPPPPATLGSRAGSPEPKQLSRTSCLETMCSPPRRLGPELSTTVTCSSEALPPSYPLTDPRRTRLVT